jgi:transposase
MTRAGLGSTRVELFEAIRRDARREDVSVRELARRYAVHRRTVRQALASATPPARKTPVRRAPRLDPVKPLIDAMLRGDVDAPRKQRHTARRVHARLVDEYGHADMRYPTVRDYVRRRRPEIELEAGAGRAEAMVPQTHQPGAEAEVDFAEFYADVAGVRTKLFLFTLRLSHSGKAVHRAFASQSQEAFLEGHIHAFTVLGGVPWHHIRYDNLRTAVSRVLFGRRREESQRWVEFRSHYGSTRSTASPVSTARTRRAASRARAGGSGAITWSRSRRSPRSPSSTRVWPRSTTPRTIAGSPIGPGLSGRTSPSKRRCCGRCRVRCSRRGSC